MSIQTRTSEHKGELLTDQNKETEEPKINQVNKITEGAHDAVKKSTGEDLIEKCENIAAISEKDVELGATKKSGTTVYNPTTKNGDGAHLHDEKEMGHSALSIIGESEDVQISAKRPQTLPGFPCAVDSVKDVLEQGSILPGSGQGKHSVHVVSLASHMEQHQLASAQVQHHQSTRETSLLVDSVKHFSSFPAVVEDPNTPMSRTVSPPVTNVLKSEVKTPSPTIPTVIQEEKSPTLLAQEALARSHTQNITPVAPLVASIQDKTSSVADAQSKTRELTDNQTEPRSLMTRWEENVPEAEPKHKTTTSERTKKEKEQTEIKTLYPSLQAESAKSKTKSVGPMTLHELFSLYYNPELASNDMFVADFIQV